ncbi:MAG TPA: hypothetical protein VLQ76_00735 [Bacteroidales bacterium]|nr:hypothetical protein [Bacteroidales bacterium]
MKKIVFFLIAVTVTLSAGAQKISNGYLRKIPALPADACNVTRAAIESFTQQVSALAEQLKGESDTLNETVDEHMKSTEGSAQETAMKQMSQQYGLSQADIEKMKNSKNMTAAEKQALANQMMSQQTNMTVEEAKSVGKMSEAGKKAYAEAYAMEAMATNQADPKQQAKNENAKNQYQLESSQQAINSKLSDIGQKIAALYSPIEADPERQKMLDRMDAWHNKIMSMTGIDYGQGKQMDSLAVLIKNEKIAYCNKFTPRYRAALRKHRGILKTSLPDYQASGNVMAEVTKAQTGIIMPADGTEIPALQAIDQYLKALQGAYKYKLYFPEDDN